MAIKLNILILLSLSFTISEQLNLDNPKISIDLQIRLNSGDSTLQEDILIEFAGGNSKAIRDFNNFVKKAELSRTLTRAEKISDLVTRLQDHSSTSQLEVVNFLEKNDVEYRTLYVTNEIFVENVGSHIISRVANFTKVSNVRPIGEYKPVPDKPVLEVSDKLGDRRDGTGSSYLQQINGRCRNIQCLGKGVVVAILDGGVLPTHVELKDNFRTEYGWFDPVEDSVSPYVATNSRGTHLAAIAVGKNIGIAPEAQWIACQIYRYKGPANEYMQKVCGEWILCPWIGKDTTTRNCAMAPDIVIGGFNMQYRDQFYLPNNYFYGTLEAWNAAGIMSSFAAGDEGSYCTSVLPPATYDIALAVGAVDNTSSAPWWSSKGPALNLDWDTGTSAHISSCKNTCGSSNSGWGWNQYDSDDACTIIKPDLVAPGDNIYSASVDSDYSYEILSGTAQSSAVVAGVTALMACADGRNSGHGQHKLNQAGAADILKRTANTKRINLAEGNQINTFNNFPKLAHLICDLAYEDGCVSFPNNVYGFGEVDACSAVAEVQRGHY